MGRLYAGFSLGTIVLGLLHVAAATRAYEALTQAALWFVSGGLMMILTGVLNLLNRRYGRLAPGLRRVCIATNVVMTAFALVAGLVGRASMLQLVVVVGLFGGVSLLALVAGLVGRASMLQLVVVVGLFGGVSLLALAPRAE